MLRSRGADMINERSTRTKMQGTPTHGSGNAAATPNPTASMNNGQFET